MARMKVIHRLGERAIKKEGEGFFLLTDKGGSYLSLGSPWNITHMQGMFHLDKNWDMYKSLDNIYLNGEITELENNFDHVVRRYSDSEEEMWLTATSLIYEVRNYSGAINVDVDFRGIFDFDDKNRIYSINKEKDTVIIHFEKHNKWLAIKGVNNFEVMGIWEQKNYPYDNSRHTKSDFYIYKALKIHCDKNLKLFIAFAENKQEAIDGVESASLNESMLKKALKSQTKKICRRDKIPVNAVVHSLYSLRNIIGKGGGKIEGIFAGLPWFFQFYARDELISLKAFMLDEQYGFVKKRLMTYLDAINEQGRVPNRLPDSKLASADAVGWLFKRFYDFLTILDKKKLLNKYFTTKDLTNIKHKLHFSIEEHMVNYMEDYVIYNEAKETWMDTFMDDEQGRAGACIEIQTLFLSSFKLMNVLCKQLKLTYHGYGLLEKMFVKQIKKDFFKNGNLYDRINDPIIRPNVFLAYYTYPDLLSKTEWIIVFNKAIRALWLDWGGLSSVDKNHPSFKPSYSGQNNQSYHQGDSWYWINNLAAVCMFDLDLKKFDYFIEHIYHSSQNEMLFSGFIGHCAEVSSANEQKSEGCFAQAWSSATYIELMDKLKQL
ncbi:MAG: amylo-alpha-1,6-glucosidase [archaeon]